MNRRCQRSTLFPYTTLFRSDAGGDAVGVDLQTVAGDVLVPGQGRQQGAVAAGQVEDMGALGDPVVDQLEVGPVHHGRVDRKSTRLNSSHVRISYAVFCLKKK